MQTIPQPIQSPMPRHQPTGKPKRTPWLIIGGVAAAGFFALMSVFIVLAYVLLSGGGVAPGVAVAGVDVGGMDQQAAREALQTAFSNQPVRLTDGERAWDSTFAEMGMQFDLLETFNAVDAAAPDAQLNPRYVLDLNRTQQTLVSLGDQVNIDAAPGGDAGRAMEIPVMLDRLRVDAYGELSDGVFELAMMQIEAPEIEVVETYTGATTSHIVEAGQELGLIAKEYGVDIADVVSLNDITDANLIYPGQELLIPAAGVYTPQAPPAPLQTGKSILVDTSAQRIYAYENGELVHSHLTSTGRAETPTVLGDYNIYVKYVKDDMRGADYFLPDVPYTMYFHRGYGIHGTYWHNSFGRPMSHGCVNLPIDEAEWFFNFAEVGTLVRVI